MILNLYLDNDQAEQLTTVFDLLDDDEITIEDYANELFGDLLAHIWHDLTKEVLS